jgi:hypothetical protein
MLHHSCSFSPDLGAALFATPTGGSVARQHHILGESRRHPLKHALQQ